MKTSATTNPEAVMATALTGIMATLHVVREAVQGYKTQLEADGWSPTMAEMMAAQLHSALIAKMFA
jgi:hypothetical protein